MEGGTEARVGGRARVHPSDLAGGPKRRIARSRTANTCERALKWCCGSGGAKSGGMIFLKGSGHGLG